MELTTFGGILANYRLNRLKWSRERLAEKLNVSARTIYNWEIGEPISEQNLIKVIKTLNNYGAFIQGQEEIEAKEIWDDASLIAKRSFEPFSKYDIIIASGKSLPNYSGVPNIDNSTKLKGERIEPKPLEKQFNITELKSTVTSNKTINSKLNEQSSFFINYVPPFPKIFYGREKDLQIIRKKIAKTNKKKMSEQQMIVIQGWPGVGKGTLVTAIIYDLETRQVFNDGILWASLGQEPNILSMLVEWGRTLELEKFDLVNYRNINEATTRLRTQLLDKKCLIILDDVWKEEDAAPFIVGGIHCATLVTTRLNSIATQLTIGEENIYKLKILQEKDAMRLLTKIARDVTIKEQSAASELLNEIQYLPLAIQVAGSLLRNESIKSGLTISKLLKDLQEDAKSFLNQTTQNYLTSEDEPRPTINILFRKSTDYLDPITRHCFMVLGGFAPKPAQFGYENLEWVWKRIPPFGVEITDVNVKEIAFTLVERGLLETAGSTLYVMHALLVLHARNLIQELEILN